MNSTAMTQIERERALFEYSLALEHGDFDRITRVLKLTEADPIFEQMFHGLNDAYVTEADQTTQAEAAGLIRRLLNEHLPSGMLADEQDLPPLTVGDVVARMQTETTARGVAGREQSEVTSKLRNDVTELPAQLGLRNVQQLFEQLRVTVSQQFQKVFRETAILLAMGREQHQAQLAATRRQKQQREQHRERQQNVDPERDEDEGDSGGGDVDKKEKPTP